jgi:hypothetical protein
MPLSKPTQDQDEIKRWPDKPGAVLAEAYLS